MTAEQYEQAAEEYLASLPLEHFMEATPQATQREITLESFALVRRARADFHYFNELLIQYFYKGNLRRVVPDNMVVVGQIDERRRGSYAPELEPAPPLWVLEYVSRANPRKDYVGNFKKFRRELKVPYHLLFEPEARPQVLQLSRHDGAAYVPCAPSAEGRCPIPELEIEVGLVAGWMRYWFRGELLPLPAELQTRLDQQAEQLRRQAEQLRQQAEQLRHLEDQVGTQADQLKARQELLDAQVQQLQQRDAQLEMFLTMLRPLVEAGARQAGRQDILDQLPATKEAAVLQRWLAELG
jgi:Uma2 family endonuclease